MSEASAASVPAAEAAILFLDDEPNVLNALRRVFQDEDIPLFFTTSPEEALEKVAAGGVGVAVSDHRMPSMTGVQFLEKVKLASPETARILLTGHADVKIAMDAINKGAVYRFLSKPWDDGELLHTVKQAHAHHTLVTENRRLTELTMTQNHQLRDLNENLERKVEERTKEIAGLNKELEKSFLGSVRVMAGLAEVHSKVIGSHSRRVAALSKAVAVRLGLPKEDIIQVEVAALLHDAGKMAIPAETLRKPEAALDPQERDLMRRHPTMGETLVRMVPNMEKAARLVRHHHELFEGGGFPDKLKGEDIPIGSRIIAVVDAYDNALNIRSIYESASPERAYKEVRSLARKELDPKVLDALGSFLEASKASADEGEVEVELKDLRTGMVLSREIRNARGVLLVQARAMLTADLLKTLRDYPEGSLGGEGVFIFRKPPGPVSGPRPG